MDSANLYYKTEGGGFLEKRILDWDWTDTLYCNTCEVSNFIALYFINWTTCVRNFTGYLMEYVFACSRGVGVGNYVFLQKVASCGDYFARNAVEFK